MNERDLQAEQSFARRVVDQVGAGARELLEGGPHVGDLVRDVMHPRPALGEEPPDRGVVAGGLEQLDPAFADPERGRAHTLAVHGRLMLHLGAEQPRVRSERLVQIADRNAKVMNSQRLHGSEATARAEPPDLPSDPSRSVRRAKPAYAEAASCGAATRSLAALHG